MLLNVVVLKILYGMVSGRQVKKSRPLKVPRGPFFCSASGFPTSILLKLRDMKDFRRRSTKIKNLLSNFYGFFTFGGMISNNAINGIWWHVRSIPG
jgi:hypothetical protein